MARVPRDVANPWKHEIILIPSDHAPIETEPPTHHRTNCMHIDITPTGGIDAAMEEIIRLGGRVKESPSLYPDPERTTTTDRSSTGRSCRIPSAMSSASSTTSQQKNQTLPSLPPTRV